jgi:UDP-N-acetylmuramate dehydrogenase
MSRPALGNGIRRLWAEVDISGRVLFNQPLAAHTSLGIGGPAQVLVFPRGIDDLLKISEFASRHELPWLILGGGSNLLVRDEGVSGIVICLKEGFNSISRRGECLVVQAGASLAMVVRFAVEEGLGGLEALAGIPGTLGGAIYMNAGTPQGCIAQVLEEVKLLRADRQLKVLPKEQLEFGYRRSHLPPGSVILEARLKLTPRSRVKIEEKTKKMLAQRAKSQPIGEKSAGCVFKNPPGKYAGELIEAVGLKGYCLGDAQVSPKHANFIINRGQATAKDILRLIELIKQRVWEEKGVKLEEEVIIIGQEKVSDIKKTQA